MINSKGGIMQNMEQTNPETGALTDAELDSIHGGNWLGNAIRAVGHFIVGGALSLEKWAAQPTWLHLSIWLPLTLPRRWGWYTARRQR